MMIPNIPALVAMVVMILMFVSIAADFFCPRFHAWVRVDIAGQTRGQWMVAVETSIVMVCIFLAML